MSEANENDINPGEKKIVLNLAGELSENLVKVFESFNVTLVTAAADKKIDFILVKDIESSYLELAKQYQVEEKKIQIISLTAVDDWHDFFSSGGRGWINENLLSCDKFLETFDRFFNHSSSLHLEDIYSNLQYKSEVIKLTGHMNVGYYMDIIGTEALAAGHNVIAIRKFFLNAISYLNYLYKSDIGRFPIEIDYMIKDDRMDMQMYCSVENFLLEYMKEAFMSSNKLNPLRGVLSECALNSDFFDIYYLEKSSKIVLSAAFLKDELVKSDDYFPSMLMNEIDSFKQFEAKAKERFVRLRLEQRAGLDAEALEHEPLPGEGIEQYREKRLIDDLPLFKKVLGVITELREKEEPAKEIVDLSFDDVEEYLKNYDTPEEIDFINDVDYQDLINALLNSIEFVVEQNEERHQGTDHIKDEYTRVSGGERDKDGNYIIKGGNALDNKGSMRFISGQGGDSSNDNAQRIKGGAGVETRPQVWEQRLEQANKTHEKQTKDMMRELEEARLQLSNVVKDKQEIEKLAKENYELKASLETSSKRIEVLSKKIDEAQGGKSGGMSTSSGEGGDENTSSEEALRRQYNKLRQDLEHMTTNAKKAEITSRQLETDLKRANNQLERYKENEADNKSSEVKIRNMEGELKTAQAEVGRKEKQITALTQKAKVLAEQLAKVQKAAQNNKPQDTGKIAKIENRMKQVDTANKNLTRERDQLKKEVADKKKDVVMLQKENQTLRNQNQELERKLKVKRAA